MSAVPTIAEIVRRVDPSLRVVGDWVLGGGLSSDMVAVEAATPSGAVRRFVVRSPKPGAFMANPQRIAHEFKALTLLEAAGIPAPRPVLLAPRHDDQPADYMVTSFIDGAPEFAPANLYGFVDQLADVLAPIHRIGVETGDVAIFRDHTATVSGYLAMDLSGLDETLEIARLADALRAVWPPASLRKALLHGDYGPGNVLWRDGGISAVVDWESTGIGDPLADVAVMRLNLLWMAGRDAMEDFTSRYAAHAGADLAPLPCWDLVAALRPAIGIDAWAAGWAAAGRPDVTAETMRADHKMFRNEALGRLGL